MSLNKPEYCVLRAIETLQLGPSEPATIDEALLLLGIAKVQMNGAAEEEKGR